METSHQNRSFGVLFFFVFVLIAVWPMIDGLPIRIWAVPFSIVFLILGITNSKLLSPFKYFWIKLGKILGNIISPIIMILIYFLLITPIGLFMRIIGKDILGLKFKNTKSYWIKRSSKVNSMRRQF